MKHFTTAEVRKAIERMWRMWPDADRVRYGECHCRRRGLMLSFTDQHTRERSEGREETCGYWCATCNWGNAGGRMVDATEDTYLNWNDDSEVTP